MLNKGVNSKTLNEVRNKLNNIEPISNANISYENASEEENSFGKLIGNFIGVPKLIQIVYNGDIRINPDYELNPNIKTIIYYDKKTILIRNKPDNIVQGNECFFEYIGNIDNLVSATVYGYKGKSIYLQYKDHLKDTWLNNESTWLNCNDVWAPDIPEVPSDRLNKIRLQYKSRTIERFKTLTSYKRKELLNFERKLGGSNYFSSIGDKNK